MRGLFLAGLAKFAWDGMKAKAGSMWLPNGDSLELERHVGSFGLPVADGPKTTLRPSVPIRFVFGSPLGNSPKSRRNASKTVPLLVPISRP